MSELILGDKRNRGYGTYFKGRVEAEDRSIDVAWREPAKSDKRSDVAYVMVHGWFGPKISMRSPAIEATRANHTGITFEYTNRIRSNALEQNAADLSAVVDAVSDEYRKRIIALSMGGKVTTMALDKMNVEAATLVAPAGYLPRNPSRLEVLAHAAAEAPEILGMPLSHPRQTLHLGVKSLCALLQRGPAVIGEMEELLQTNEPGAINKVAMAPNSPHLRLMYGDSDRLLPPWTYEESLPGLPFDHVERYSGGHAELVKNPLLAQHIFQLDRELPVPQQPLPAVA
ncbi:alpha/beta hydrolase [Candidatus Parcubacteria bacterium]|nr:alpha/beta hydrolase [Candidatus Parcubacteria bacterium]